jgi:hypothetical protein
MSKVFSLAAMLAASVVAGCAQIIAGRDAVVAKENATACIQQARISPDGQLIYGRLWVNDGTDTAAKLSDPNPLTMDERNALVRHHYQVLPCRQIILDHDNRFAAWEAPYWQELFRRSDEIYVRLASGELPVGTANRLSIESFGKFQADVSRGHANAVAAEEIRQQRASEAMLMAGSQILAASAANQPRTTTTNCSWFGNTINCVGTR